MAVKMKLNNEGKKCDSCSTKKAKQLFDVKISKDIQFTLCEDCMREITVSSLKANKAFKEKFKYDV